MCQVTLSPSVAFSVRLCSPVLPGSSLTTSLFPPYTLLVSSIHQDVGHTRSWLLGFLFVAASQYLLWGLAGGRWAMNSCKVEDPGCAPWPGGSAFRYLNHLFLLVSLWARVGPRFLICQAWLNKINTLEVLRPVLGILSVLRK